MNSLELQKNNQEIDFCPANSNDIEQLIELDEEASRSSTGIGFTIEDREQKRKDYQEWINNPRYKILLMKDGGSGKKIGMAVIELGFSYGEYVKVAPSATINYPLFFNINEIDSLVNNKNQNIKRAHIRVISIDKIFQGLGKGSLAIKKIVQVLSEQGVDIITLDTGIDNIVMQRTAKGFTFVEGISHDGGYDETQGKRLIGIRKLQKELILKHEQK
jgi:hypothetical protein